MSYVISSIAQSKLVMLTTAQNNLSELFIILVIILVQSDFNFILPELDLQPGLLCYLVIM